MGTSSSKKPCVIHVAEAIQIQESDTNEDDNEEIDDITDIDDNADDEEDEISLNSDNTLFLTSLLEDYSTLVTNNTLQEIKKFMKGYVGFARLSMPTISSQIKSGELNMKRSRTFRQGSPSEKHLRNAYSIYGSGSVMRRRSIPKVNLDVKENLPMAVKIIRSPLKDQLTEIKQDVGQIWGDTRYIYSHKMAKRKQMAVSEEVIRA